MSTANAKHTGNRRKLTRAEKKEIAALIQAAKGDGKAHTAQQTIVIREKGMYQRAAFRPERR